MRQTLITTGDQTQRALHAGPVAAALEAAPPTTPLLLESSDQTQPALRSKITSAMKLGLPNLLERVRPRRLEAEASDGESASGWLQRGVVAYENRQYGKALIAWKKAATGSAAE